MTTISVVIPCHNYGRFIGEALASVDKQSRRPDEIVILDDGSTDGSAEVIQRLVARRADVRCLYRSEAQGVVATLNEMVGRASGELIVRLDADDRLSPEYLERCSDAIAINNWDFAYTDLKMFGGESAHLHHEFDAKVLTRWNYIPTSAMFRRTMFDRVGGYDVAFDRLGWEDWDFWLSAVLSGAEGGWVSGAWLEWRRHGQGSRSDGIGFRRTFQLHRILHRKYPMDLPSPYSARLMALLVLSLVPEPRRSVITRTFKGLSLRRPSSARSSARAPMRP
jgi:glycosyltransferase involved in cell wall biosynthesis